MLGSPWYQPVISFHTWGFFTCRCNTRSGPTPHLGAQHQHYPGSGPVLTECFRTSLGLYLSVLQLCETSYLISDINFLIIKLIVDKIPVFCLANRILFLFRYWTVTNLWEGSWSLQWVNLGLSWWINSFPLASDWIRKGHGMKFWPMTHEGDVCWGLWEKISSVENRGLRGRSILSLMWYLELWQPLHEAAWRRPKGQAHTLRRISGKPSSG